MASLSSWDEICTIQCKDGEIVGLSEDEHEYCLSHCCQCIAPDALQERRSGGRDGELRWAAALATLYGAEPSLCQLSVSFPPMSASLRRSYPHTPASIRIYPPSSTLYFPPTRCTCLYFTPPLTPPYPSFPPRPGSPFMSEICILLLCIYIYAYLMPQRPFLMSSIHCMAEEPPAIVFRGDM